MDSDLHVVFGTAALGQAVMRQLVDNGKRVRMVSRSGRITSPVEPVPAEVEVVKGDAADPASPREVCLSSWCWPATGPLDPPSKL